MSVMARELHIPVNADVEQRGELPMEMMSGGRRDAAQHLDAQMSPRCSSMRLRTFCSGVR
jgi:hypothetical protein